MEAKDIEIGGEYAAPCHRYWRSVPTRPGAGEGSERTLEGRVDRPNPGLVDYVKSANLIVRWKQRKPFR